MPTYSPSEEPSEIPSEYPTSMPSKSPTFSYTELSNQATIGIVVVFLILLVGGFVGYRYLTRQNAAAAAGPYTADERTGLYQGGSSEYSNM